MASKLTTPRLEEEEDDGNRGMTIPRDEKSAAPATSTTTGRKRSTSGSLISKLSFLRPSSESRLSASEESIGQNAASPDAIRNIPTSPPKKGRSRKGSLRKTALLGTGKLRLDRRNQEPDQAFSPTRESKPTLSSPKEGNGRDATSRLPREDEVAEQGPAITPAPAKPKVVEDESDGNQSLLQRSRRSTLDDVSASTTSDEDNLHGPVTMSSYSRPAPPKKPSADTYFPPMPRTVPLPRALVVSPHPKSPLGDATATLPLEPLPSAEDWDYSETEWWGWVILATTWGVFVMGMGSCLGVWSWAWDVGETPYAPPELEDDPTLPIVGYYPALIILTGVMAWVWVVVAWVGMKYFRHAKMQ